VEAREGARLSPGTFPVPPHALLPTHISLQKKSLDFVWLITYGHQVSTEQAIGRGAGHSLKICTHDYQLVGLRGTARECAGLRGNARECAGLRGNALDCAE